MPAAGTMSAAGATPSRRKAGYPVKLPVLLPAKQRRKGGGEHVKDVLRSVHLEADSGGRPSYMPYDKMRFPRVTRDAGGDGAAELDSMWMVGFLDHEDDTGPTGPEVKAVREYEVRRLHCRPCPGVPKAPIPPPSLRRSALDGWGG